MRALALVLTVAACSYKPGAGGELTGDSPQGDGPQPVDTPDPDAPPDSFVGPTPSACVEKWLSGVVPSFTNPAFVDQAGPGSINTQENERDPFISSDELQLYYSRDLGGGPSEVLFADRASAAAPFNAPIVKTTLNDMATEDSKVTMTGDDLTAFVSSRRATGEGASDLWEATRTTGGIALFDVPATQTHLAAVNDAGDQLDPHVSPDGLRLYLAINNPQQIAVASRTSPTGNFSTPVVIPGIGDVAGDADPTLTGDERVLIFASQRTGLGGTDLWYATRAERDQPFGAVQALLINTAQNDSDPQVTADGCRIYFSSTRADGNDDFDLLVTTMTP